jgi:hypothetical protein
MPPSVFTRGDSTRPARQEAPVAAASLEKRAGRHLAGLGRADGSLIAIGLTSCDPIDAGLSSMAPPTWSPSMASDARRCKPGSSPAMNMTLSASANEWLHPDKLTRLCTVPIIGVLESDWDLGSFAMESRRRAVWTAAITQATPVDSDSTRISKRAAISIHGLGQSALSVVGLG